MAEGGKGNRFARLQEGEEVGTREGEDVVVDVEELGYAG